MTTKQLGIALLVLVSVVIAAGATLVVFQTIWRQTANGSVEVTSLSQIAGEHTAVAQTAGILPAPILQDAPVVLEIVGDRRSFRTGCNNGGGLVTVRDSRLEVRDLMLTAMACPPDRAAQEKWVVEMLTSKPRLERSGWMLYLHWGPDEKYWITFWDKGQVPTPQVKPT
jgi:heat shock protein HslJ